MPSPRRHLLTAAAAWAVLSVVSVALVAGIQILPEIASREAQVEDAAFVLLTAAAMPVLMFVLVGLAYSALRFRASDDDDADGPPIHGHGGVQAVWLGVSSLLVLGLFGYGAVGLLEIRGSEPADYVVEVVAEQWAWHFIYPDGTETKELHVPVDRRVRLDITSDDAIHSLWIPAFGIKQDAVQGRTTYASMTVTQPGTYGGMCAELCGLGHTGMTVTVVAQSMADLEAWLHDQPPVPE